MKWFKGMLHDLFSIDEDNIKKEVLRRQDVYSLKLHEKTVIRNMVIIRVPGGWIYTWHSMSSSAVFVPYHVGIPDREMEV